MSVDNKAMVDGVTRIFNLSQSRVAATALALDQVWGEFELKKIISSDEIFRRAVDNRVNVDEFACWADNKHPGILAELARGFMFQATNNAALLEAMLPSEPLVVVEGMTANELKEVESDAEVRKCLTVIDEALRKTSTAFVEGNYLEALMQASNAECASQFIIAIILRVSKTADGALNRAFSIVEMNKANMVAPIFCRLRSLGRTHEVLAVV